MTSQFRLSDDHAADIAALAGWLRQRGGKLPVWLVGTSMGTLSAASAAGRLGDTVDGVILTSSISRAHRNYVYPPNGVMGLDLERITAPTLVVAHAGDACAITPPSDAPRIVERLSASRRAELLVVKGGAEAKSGECQAMSAHGYFGIEGEVVDAMAAFIRAASPGR